MNMPVVRKKNQPPAPDLRSVAVFIGRFQPFHTGHLEALGRMQAENASVKLLVGSSNRSRTRENPLTFTERRAHIRSAVGTGIPVLPLPDDPSDAVWVRRLRRHLSPGSVVYSGNDWVLGLCARAGIPCRPIAYRVDISATRIRSMIAEGADYRRFVPGGNLPAAIFSVLRS